eukprot:m.116581 g.116581  ORF g.116581 m.116581 type:complete len:337 (+) comp21632_c0_seq1:113-1123(+)
MNRVRAFTAKYGARSGSGVASDCTDNDDGRGELGEVACNGDNVVEDPGDEPLLWCVCPLHNRHGGGVGLAIGRQLFDDRFELSGAHQDDDRVDSGHHIPLVDVGGVAREHDERLALVPVGNRHPHGGSSGQHGRDPGHNLPRHSSGVHRRNLLLHPAKHQRVPPLEPDHAVPGLCTLHNQIVDLGLRRGVGLAAALSNNLDVPSDQLEQLRVGQLVCNHHVGILEELLAPDRDEVDAARSCADQEHPALDVGETHHSSSVCEEPTEPPNRKVSGRSNGEEEEWQSGGRIRGIRDWEVVEVVVPYQRCEVTPHGNTNHDHREGGFAGLDDQANDSRR